MEGQQRRNSSGKGLGESEENEIDLVGRGWYIVLPMEAKTCHRSSTSRCLAHPTQWPELVVSALRSSSPTLPF